METFSVALYGKILNTELAESDLVRLEPPLHPEFEVARGSGNTLAFNVGITNLTYEPLELVGDEGVATVVTDHTCTVLTTPSPMSWLIGYSHPLPANGSSYLPCKVNLRQPSGHYLRPGRYRIWLQYTFTGTRSGRAELGPLELRVTEVS